MKIFLIILLIPFLSFFKSIEEGFISNSANNAAVPSGVVTDLAGKPRFAEVPEKANTGSGTSPR